MLLLAFAISFDSHPAAGRAAPLRPWTTRLRDAEGDAPTLLRYPDRRGAALTFIGAVHDNDPRSATFRLIDQAARRWRPAAVIVEGVPTAWGPDDPQVTALAREALDQQGMQPNGETVPAVRAALRAHATLWGGEADDEAVKRFVRAHGVPDRDLLGFYVLRVVPQWLREQQIASTRDPALAGLVNRQLARSRADLGVAADVLPDFAEWSAWYARLQRKPLTVGLADDEAGPLADGRWPTNRISELVGRARDAHLARLIGKLLRQRGSVMVVYGASHAVVTRPTLDVLLGPPCYAGTRLAGALARCDARRGR